MPAPSPQLEPAANPELFGALPWRQDGTYGPRDVVGRLYWRERHARREAERLNDTAGLVYVVRSWSVTLVPVELIP